MQSKQLKASDFTSKGNTLFVNVGKKVPGILLIYADWCGHCHRFLPVFNELSNTLGPNFVCAAIESEHISQALHKQLNFQGYPTIKFFDQNGKIVGEYKGERNKKNILDYICTNYHHCIKYH